MKANVNSIIINGVEYIPKSEESAKQAQKLEGMPYVIIRSQSAGVFAGYLKSNEKDIVVLKKARRIWYWSGAATLSQLAEEGTKKPEDCKFPCEVTEMQINQVIEILYTTDRACVSIQEVPVWSA